MQQLPAVLYSRKMFKLVFVLYKLQKGNDPIEVSKLIKADKMVDEHISISGKTEFNYDSQAGSQPNFEDYASNDNSHPNIRIEALSLSLNNPT
jgi:hypothetical protein